MNTDNYAEDVHEESCPHHQAHAKPFYGVLDDNKNVVPIPMSLPQDIHKWGAMFSDLSGRQVQRDTIGGQTLSTVFLGVNHSWNDEDQWFETALFGTKDTIILERYATYAQALKGHRELLGCLQRGEEIPDRAGL